MSPGSPPRAEGLHNPCSGGGRLSPCVGLWRPTLQKGSGKAIGGADPGPPPPARVGGQWHWRGCGISSALPPAEPGASEAAAGRLMRGSRECSAPSPERAARAGARRPRGAASGADTAEPRRRRVREPPGIAANPPGDAVLPLHDREAPLPLPPALPSCLPGAGRAAQQRLGVQHRRNAINKGGHLPSARCQPAGTAPGSAGGLLAPTPLLSRGRGEPERRGGEVRGQGAGDALRGRSGRGCIPTPRTVPRAHLAGSATSAPT